MANRAYQTLRNGSAKSAAEAGIRPRRDTPRQTNRHDSCRVLLANP
jgi:hypothetical protein